MEKWQKSLQKAVSSVSELAERFGLPPESAEKVSQIFPFRIPPHYLALIREKGDPIYRQCVPDEQELAACEELLDDPLGEEKYAKTANVVVKYPDHCLFLVSTECAMYCRFCTRKRKFRTHQPIDKNMIDEGIEYIRSNPEIHDVLVSGGDPFLLETDKIEYILKNLRTIPHVDVIRIGTRTPCVLPERINRRLVNMLKKYPPLYVNVHFNHPAELTPEAVAALGKLADAGVVLGSQTVLLKGVNDDPAIIRELMLKLLAARVRPYYLFQCDMIYGTRHFRTPLSRGLEILEAMRGHTSGMAIPHFVIDLPRGGGKIPLVPDYLLKQDGNKLIFRNPHGDSYGYTDVEQE